MSLLSRTLKVILPSSLNPLPQAQALTQQTRSFSLSQPRGNNWPDWRMLKDYNKRLLVKEFGAERSRLNAIKKLDFLPRELREAAHNDIQALPRYSNHIWTVPRCVITSRPRAVRKPWNLSRIMFRHLADYNKLAGVQRGLW